MSAGQPNSTIDPTLPQGSETLKLGDNRIRDLATGVLRFFGFDGTTLVDTLAPFGVDPITGLAEVVGDPVTPLGIATAQYAGRKALFASVTSGDNATYGGSTDPVTGTPYDQNAIYIIQNADVGPNSGAATLQLNSSGIVPLLRANGSALTAGNFQGGGTIYLVVWDTANFRIIDYIGGPVPLPVVLPGNPDAALQATPKQYVDSAIDHPTSTPLGTIVAVTSGAATDILEASIDTPDDGNSYLLQVSYGLWVERTSGTVVQVETWVEANGVLLATGGARLTNDGGGSVGTTSGGGVCMTVFAPNTTITAKLRAQTSGGDINASPSDANFPDAPATYLVLQLLRTTA